MGVRYADQVKKRKHVADDTQVIVLVHLVRRYWLDPTHVLLIFWISTLNACKPGIPCTNEQIWENLLFILPAIGPRVSHYSSNEAG